jgi:tocopherol O-methyltransferase
MVTTDSESLQRAADLYEDVQPFYRRFYSDIHIHYGYWGRGIRSSRAAAQNTSRTVCGLLGLRAGDLVLDAGCGLGGTSILLAREYAARVEGVDSSRSNVEQATKNAEAANVPGVSFSLQDHRHTRFESDYFDHVIAIESISAGDCARDFLAEAHRVLKENGRLAIVAMHLSRASGGEPLFPKRHGSHLAFEANRSREEFCGIVEAAGFQDGQSIDLMDRIHLASRSWRALPALLVLALSRLGIVSPAIGENLQTLWESEDAMKRRQLAMAMFLGRKAHRECACGRPES